MFSNLHLFSRFKLPWILCCVYHIATSFVCYVIIFIFILVSKNLPTAAARVHGDRDSIPLVKPRLGKRILFVNFFVWNFFKLCCLQGIH
jgi:hypothetical protein